MEKSVEDGANYKACTECARVCQTTHGKGLPHSVPRFSKGITDYSTPSFKDCNLQIPASYIRAHIHLTKEKFILEGVTGSEWVVAFSSVGFKDGWKAFATDYQLEKGDLAMFALVAPKRFYVNVFDKFGMEKFSTGQPVTSRGSPSTVVNKAIELGGPRNESPVSKSTSRADGTPQHTPTQALKPNGSFAQTSGQASGQNGSHDEKLTPLSRKRALIEKEHLPHEPVEDHEADPSSTSQFSEASDDSVQVRLAKAVLAKAKQKKLKKRKTSCTSTQVEAVTEAVKSEGALLAEEPELFLSLHDEDKAMELEDRISKGVAILSRYVDPVSSPRGDGDDTILEKPCEDPSVGVSNDDLVTPDVGHGRSDCQNLPNGVTHQPVEAVVQEIPSPDQSQNEALDETETARRAAGEDPVLQGSEIRQAGELQPIPAFQPGLVKQEPGLGSSDPHHHQSCTKCTNCGLTRKENTPIQPRNLKAEPLTSECPETPKIESPSSNAPSFSTRRVTEDQKQRALIAAKNHSASRKNPNAQMVMRISFNEESYDCFVSVQCAEILPKGSTGITVMDAEGRKHGAYWNADRRYIQGPGWREFVDSHNLQIHDACVMEVVENSELECVVLVHIFHAHEMENLPVRASPVVTDYGQAFPAGAKTRSSNLLHGCSPLSTKTRARSPNVDEAVGTELPRPLAHTADARAVTELPVPSTMRNPRRASSSPSTWNPHALPAVPPSSAKKRMRAPNVEEAVQTEPPRPVAYTADARVATELPEPSAMTRPRRMTYSALQPATARDSVPPSDTSDEPPRGSIPTFNTSDEPSKVAVSEQANPAAMRVKQKAVRQRRHSLYTPHVPKMVAELPEASKATVQQSRATDESGKQGRTRNSPRKVQYPVAKLIDRRKSVQGVLFLVELAKPVSQSSIHKRMKSRQDDKGRWWVPHHHFTKDFNSCYIE